MPTLQAVAAVDMPLIKSTSTSKFDTMLAAAGPTSLPFVMQDTFGAEGYVPTALGGLGPAQEWVNDRVLHSVDEFAVRFVGKVYENSIQVKKDALRISPVATAAKYAALLANDAIAHSPMKALGLLNANANGFDREPLFGAHTYVTGGDSFTNLIEGTGPRWYLLNDESLVEATADGYQQQVYGGDNTEIDFMKDSIAMGWRAVKIFAPGFWANAVCSQATLNSANLRAGINLQAGFKNDKGVRLGSKSKYLAVTRSNAAAGEALIKAALVGGGNTNLDMGRLQLLILDDLAD